eukprot:TRINITY_DN2560_c0_g1_i23.p2 TRINITY_DN2560_c0_g1~~TRINITY_DN2560_c0_g1_i23.p2  ORF type:complete len:244 (-),score=64.50 TRINITY_DN2560_c0_g1_i23:1311-2042(-)
METTVESTEFDSVIVFDDIPLPICFIESMSPIDLTWTWWNLEDDFYTFMTKDPIFLPREGSQEATKKRSETLLARIRTLSVRNERLYSPKPKTIKEVEEENKTKKDKSKDSHSESEREERSIPSTDVTPTSSSKDLKRDRSRSLSRKTSGAITPIKKCEDSEEIQSVDTDQDLKSSKNTKLPTVQQEDSVGVISLKNSSKLQALLGPEFMAATQDKDRSSGINAEYGESSVSISEKGLMTKYK